MCMCMCVCVCVCVYIYLAPCGGHGLPAPNCMAELYAPRRTQHPQIENPRASTLKPKP